MILIVILFSVLFYVAIALVTGRHYFQYEMTRNWQACNRKWEAAKKTKYVTGSGFDYTNHPNHKNPKDCTEAYQYKNGGYESAALKGAFWVFVLPWKFISSGGCNVGKLIKSFWMIPNKENRLIGNGPTVSEIENAHRVLREAGLSDEVLTPTA